MTVKPWIPLCQRPQKSETLRPTNSLHSTPTTARSSSIMVKLASESAASAAMKVEAEEGLGKRRISVPDQLYIGGMKKPRRERFLGCTTAKERISKMPPCVAGKRSSIYRGVTRHRWTGRYEAHLWDKTTWNQNQNKKGKQVYLGAYDDEEAAARAYDLAALKYWGAGTLINFPVSDYSRDLEEMQMISKEDYLISLRRKSSAFSRGFPKCRGASRHVQNSNLEPSLGRMLADDPSIEKKYGNDRKIDLTGYIRWWGSPKTRSSNEKQIANSEAINEELLAFECTKQSMEPYRFPSLGVSSNDALPHGTSSVKACNILSCSAAFKNFLHRLSETCTHDDTETGYDRNFVPIHSLNEASGERQADISVNYSELSRCSTGLTDWNPVDPVPDALFWNSLIQPAEIPSSSLSAALRKTEAGSPYTYDDEE